MKLECRCDGTGYITEFNGDDVSMTKCHCLQVRKLFQEAPTKLRSWIAKLGSDNLVNPDRLEQAGSITPNSGLHTFIGSEADFAQTAWSIRFRRWEYLQNTGLNSQYWTDQDILNMFQAVHRSHAEEMNDLRLEACSFGDVFIWLGALASSPFSGLCSQIEEFVNFRVERGLNTYVGYCNRSPITNFEGWEPLERFLKSRHYIELRAIAPQTEPAAPASKAKKEPVAGKKKIFGPGSDGTHEEVIGELRVYFHDKNGNDYVSSGGNCSLCSDHIPKGSMYFYTNAVQSWPKRGVYDGLRSCPSCAVKTWKNA